MSIDKSKSPELIKMNPFEEMMKKFKDVFWVVVVFACFINITMFITPFYSLQVLNRVLGSKSKETLLMLSIIIAFVYLVYTLLQIARSFTLIKIGEWMDNYLSPILFSRAISSAATRQIGTNQLLRDFQTVKTFLTSTGINTLLDAPWSIFALVIIFIIHPYMGWLTVGGTVITVSIAFINAALTNKILGESTDISIKGMNQAEVATRNAEVVEAMGMINNVTQNWSSFNNEALSKQLAASYRNSIISNFSRYIRNIMQMTVTGLGAYIVIDTNGTEMTSGHMILSSILVGRALAPFDNAIEMWKQISMAIKSYKNIQNMFRTTKARDESMALPNVEGCLSVENVFYTFAATNPLMLQEASGEKTKYVLEDISFKVNPGEIVAIIGPSATGKSTLAKIIVGVWKPTNGCVRIDGGEVYRWNREDFGRNVGYLPQGIELFSGSIKTNIARMSPNPDPELVTKAAKLAGAHEMILRFPEGYDSDIGVAGSNLSGGQRQRIALARAFYGDPKVIILDEPNSNLDLAGEIALANALIEAKKQNITSLVISHRQSILSVVDKVIVLEGGKVMSEKENSQHKILIQQNQVAK